MDNAMPKRILYVAHSSRVAGAELSLYLLVTNLATEKYTPVVALPEKGPMPANLERKGIKTHVYNCHWWIPGYMCSALYYMDFFAGLSTRVSALRRIIRKESIDLVHTNCATIIDGAIAAHLESVPHVWHIREMLGQPDSGLVSTLGHGPMYGIIGELSQKVIVVSDAVRSDMAPFVPPAKIRVIYNGVDARKFECADGFPALPAELLGPNRFFKVCTLGNVVERKGYRTLMKTAEYVAERNPNIAFLAAGEVADMNLYSHMLDRKKCAGLDKTFHFLGFQDDVPALLNSVDLLVLPSLNDPFPRVVLEAMAAAKPVIVTSVGGSRECVLNNETGFVVEPEDFRGIGEHILQLAKDPPKAARMGLLGRERVKAHFSVERCSSEIQGVYDDLIGKKPEFSARMAEFAERSLPLIFDISRDFEDVWANKNKLYGELRELKRLQEFEKRVQRVPLYKTYHAVKGFLMRMAGKEPINAQSSKNESEGD
jgi:glycosyltransferase involved in cell wall biosynthesis